MIWCWAFSPGLVQFDGHHLTAKCNVDFAKALTQIRITFAILLFDDIYLAREVGDFQS